MSLAPDDLAQLVPTPAHPPAGSPRPHLPQLDALRGIAALMVFCFHLQNEAYHSHYLAGHTLLPALRQHFDPLLLLVAPATMGMAGVTLFFVLSGFCIHYSFLRSSRPFAYGPFMWRRFWRIYPAYLVAIAAALLLAGWPAVRVPHLSKSLVLHLLMLHNVNNNTLYDLNPAFWTLAVEFQFYLVYPLLLAMRRRWGIGWAAGVGLVLSGVLSVVLLTCNVTSPKLIVMPAVSWGQWCLGAWIAERFVQHRPPLLPVVGTILGCGLLMAVGWSYVYWGFDALPCAVLCGLLIERWCRTGRFAPPRVLVWVGLISYSVYVFHQPIIQWVGARVRAAGDERLVILAAVAVPMVMVVSAVNYYAVEGPGIWVGHHLRRVVGRGDADRRTPHQV